MTNNKLDPELLVGGLGWPEGPTALDDGRVVFVESYRSQLTYWDPASGSSHRYAYTAGSPNATVLGSDGCLYVCQNGGRVGPWRAKEMTAPSIQRIDTNGECSILATSLSDIQFNGPNDLAFGPDGRLYFTDPGLYDKDLHPDPGYIFVLNPDGSGEVLVEVGHGAFPNGIAVEPDGGVIWDESYSGRVRRLRNDGDVELVCALPDIDGVAAVPDGLTIASNGDIYVTSVDQGGVHVVSPQGGHLAFIPVGTCPTNCLFVDEWLYVTDGGATATVADAQLEGALWRMRVGASGMPLFRGSILPARH